MPKINKKKHLYEDFFKNIFNDYFSYKSTCTNRVKKAHEFNSRTFSTRNFSVVFIGKKRTKLTKTRTTSEVELMYVNSPKQIATITVMYVYAVYIVNMQND